MTAEAFQSLVGWSDKYGFGIELMAYPGIHRKEAPYNIRRQNGRVKLHSILTKIKEIYIFGIKSDIFLFFKQLLYYQSYE